jgi:hypothetical protein
LAIQPIVLNCTVQLFESGSEKFRRDIFGH